VIALCRAILLEDEQTNSYFSLSTQQRRKEPKIGKRNNRKKMKL